MPLIPSYRHTPEDLEAWRDIELALRLHRHPPIGPVLRKIERWLGGEPASVSVSWGKDSVLTAHLALMVDPTLPLGWARIQPFENPDCVHVRDAFLSGHPAADYREAVLTCRSAVTDVSRREWSTALRDAVGSHRRISGLRGDESKDRSLYARYSGGQTANTLAPLISWTSTDVLSALVQLGLPIHSVYACTFGGRLDYRRIRTSTLTKDRGDNLGRAEWESAYYRDAIISAGLEMTDDDDGR